MGRKDLVTPAFGADADGLYPMRLVARLTGLSADTIRAWERRYEAVIPDRSAGNTRRFSAADIRRLALLREATERGHAIGAIAGVPTEQLPSLITSETRDLDRLDEGFDRWIEDYFADIDAFRLRRALERLGRAASLLDRHTFIFDVVVPIVHTIGSRWQTNEMRIVQEHIVSRQLMSVLDVVFDARGLPAASPRILLSTPPGHRHEFGVLIASLLAVTRGVEPIYLGPDLPVEELSWAVRESKADALVLSVARDLHLQEADSLAQELELIAKWAKLWIGLPSGHALVENVPSARFFHRYEDFDSALGTLRNA